MLAMRASLFLAITACAVMCTLSNADMQGSIPFVDWVDPELVLSRMSSPQFASQAATLTANAREALTHPLYSVMSSPFPPPGADPHLYYSWAPYWWPNSDCDTTDPLVSAAYMRQCNYSNRDGFYNPDIGNATQVRSLANVSSDALTLALVGAHRSDAVMLQRATLDLRLFYLDPATRMLPDLRFAQVQRGANQPWPWVGRQYGIIDARGQIFVQLAASVLRNHSALSGWTEEDERGLTRWFAELGHWLNTSAFGQAERDGANNHASWWQVQGATYAYRLNDLPAARSLLQLYLDNQFQQQINATGEQPLEAVRERPFHYRCYNLQALVYVAQVAKRLGLDLFHITNSQEGNIQKAIDFILRNVTPQVGDEDPTELVPLLYTAIEQYGDPNGEYARGIVKFGGNLQRPPFWTIWHTAMPKLAGEGDAMSRKDRQVSKQG